MFKVNIKNIRTTSNTSFSIVDFEQVNTIWVGFFKIRAFNPIQDGHFWGCSQMGGGGWQKKPLPKICQRYPTMMKLGTVIPYPKEDTKKHINHMNDIIC